MGSPMGLSILDSSARGKGSAFELERSAKKMRIDRRIVMANTRLKGCIAIQLKGSILVVLGGAVFLF